MKTAVFFLFFWGFISFSFAQVLDFSRLEKQISSKDNREIRQTDSMLLHTYAAADSQTRGRLLEFFSAHTGSSNLHTAALCLAWKAVVMSRMPFNKVAEGTEIMLRAVSKSVESGDEYLMLRCFELYGDHCLTFNKPEPALFYYLKTADMRKKLGDDFFFYRNVHHFGKLGELLYRMQDYRQSVQYIRQAIALQTVPAMNHASAINTLALCYQRMGIYDTAMYWYDSAYALASYGKDSVWQAIIQGNRGAVYFEQKNYTRALPLLWEDYRINIRNEINNAANTLHRIARIYLDQGKTDSALLLARKGFAIVNNFPRPNALFIMNACKTLRDIFRKTGQADSALVYAERFHQLNDSVNQSIALNRMDVVQTRLDFENSRNHINHLLLEKKAEKVQRNFLLGGLLLLLITAWFYFRWQKQQSLNRQQELLYQKEKAEAAMRNAQEKLESYTQNIIRNNEMIERLQEELARQHLQLNEELQQQSILTENDWLRFKDMFDKANPGFITQLKNQVPDITAAELRLATLIRLNLGNKHIASMLGISTDAVRKTKSRLRQRLQITVEDGLDEYIRKLI